jgi:hypothetical protein
LKNVRSFLTNIKVKLQKNIYRSVVFGIILLALGMRVTLYGDPALSIAGNDTASYIESSQVPLFSKEMMTGRRLLTTNLIYKVFEPSDGYQILVNGSIATTRRVVQPGFTGIVVAQLIFSIAGWVLLALSISENIKHPLMKILSVVAVVLFAFTPQIADWDSILMSESFTFSLFALQLAILIKLAFSFYKNQNLLNPAYLIVWAIIFFLWTFLRDTNLFVSFVTAGMIVILLVSFRFRNNIYLKSILVFVVAILFVGLATSGNSTRSQVQMVNIYNDDLLRSPASVSTLKKLGMPTPNSADYQVWFQENAAKSLVKFMIIHPGYPTMKIIKDFPDAFTEIKQTYFKAPELAQQRETLLELGNSLHPENTTPVMMDLLLLIGAILLAIKNKNEASQTWAWLGIWLMLTASVTLIPTILGDTWAINRHALFSTMIYRLFMWVFPIVIMDIALNQNTQTTDKT